MNNTRRISPLDNWIMDANGNLMGVQNPNANGDDLLPVTYTTDPLTGRIALNTGNQSFPVVGSLFDPVNGVSRLVDSLGKVAYTGATPQYVPVLDLNYAQTMALAGPETYARAATDTYTDIIGVSRTASTNVAAFDRASDGLSPSHLIPKGVKTGSPGQLQIADISAILPSAGFTIVVDCDTPNALQAGPVIFLSQNGGVTNRINISRGANYNAAFTAQSGGSVVVNQALGAVQQWYGGPRRMVFSIADNNFQIADDGAFSQSITTGSKPSSLNRLDIGWASNDTSYFTGWVKRIRILPNVLTAAQALNLSAGDSPRACWGDSLTAGILGSYPDTMRLLRSPHSGIYNGGVAGETSTQIKVRMVADTVRNNWTNVFWVGRNNYASASTVMADIAAMVANLTHTRFLVMSVINRSDGTENSGSAAHTQITALNAQIAAAYPNNYLDIRSLIVAASGGSNDAPHSSWTTDGLHLNATPGNAYVAAQVESFLTAKNW